MMLRLAVRTLRFRKSGFIAAFVAVALGTAIVMACGGLMETGIRSNVPAERYAAAHLVVSGKQSHHRPGADESTPLSERVGIPVDKLAKIRSVEGVSAAIGDFSVSSPVVTSQATLPTEGHSWPAARLAPYELSTGAAPGRSQVAIDPESARATGTKPGDRITLLIAGKPTRYVVSGITNAPSGHLYFSSTEAAALSTSPDRYATIGVLVAQGTDIGAVRDRLEDLGLPIDIHTGADRGTAEHPSTSAQQTALIAIAGSFGGIAAMTMMFVVASTLALAAQHREREFALLRGIGTTPGQVRRMILGEAMLVSIPAVVAGILPGLWLGRFIFDQLASNGVASPFVEFTQGWIPFAAGAGAAVLAAIGAALIAARRSAKIRPVEALAEASLQRKWFSWIRLAFGLLFLGGGLALLIVTATVMTGPLAGATAGPSVLCWAIGVAILGPFWTRIALGLIRWPLQAVSRVNGRLAIRNLTARTVTTSAAVVPVMLAVGFATANLYMQTTQVDAATKAFTRDLRADAVIASSAGGLNPALLDEVRAVPGVAGASFFVRSTGVIDEPRNAPIDSEGAPLIGVSPQDPTTGTAPVRLVSGSLSGLTGATVALPDHVAAELGRGVGTQIRMTLGDGASVDLRVVATFAAERGYESIVLPADLLAAHTTLGLPHQILVRATPGTDVTTALSALTAQHPGIRLASRDTLVERTTEDLKIQAWVNYLLVGMLIAYTAVSIVNQLASATLRRRREFSLQRLTGSTRHQVFRMLLTESTLISLTGIVLGTAVALACLLPFSAKVAGTPLPTGPISYYLLIITAAATLTFTSILIPPATTLRHPPTTPAAD